jgi:hypothetical protein
MKLFWHGFGTVEGQIGPEQHPRLQAPHDYAPVWTGLVSTRPECIALQEAVEG